MTSFWHDLPRPFFILAPMEAVTDVIFRHVIAKAGAPDLYFTEFTNATGWVHAGDKAIGGRLIKTVDETKLIAQLWGSLPSDMAKLAAHCKEIGFIGIDINMGCPDASAVKAGGGAGMILNPDNAADVISAAKSSGLPVSVKTRLGYSRIDEWRGWLTHLLQQDIENLTIHLRTKKEMSKVPAHFELIPEIVNLRDEIASGTLLTINGDIEDREQGLRLVTENPGVDGIMIGRGVFHNPFAFKPVESADESFFRETKSETQPESFLPGAKNVSARSGLSEKTTHRDDDQRQMKLLNLLRLQLDLYDQYSHLTNRPFDTLKRFFKIYVRDFEGAAELRDKLMHTKSTDDVRALLNSL